KLEELPFYDLQLSLDDAMTSFTLREQIAWTNLESAPIGEIVLRVYANSNEGGTAKKLVQFDKGSCPAVACTVAADGESAIVVKLGKPAAPGDRVTIDLSLSGHLEEIDSSRTNVLAQSLESLSMLGGAEMSSFGILAKGDDIASLANFYAVVGRRRAGAWEKSDTASAIGDLGSDEMSVVHATVEVPERAKVATTGVTIGEGVTGGRKTVDVAAAAVRDFAVVASPSFEVASRDVNGVTVRAWFLGAERAAGEKVLDAAAAALEDFEKRFGPYPYADLDVVEAALIGGAGGVEFAGLVTVASMMYRPAIPTDGLLGSLLALGNGGLPGMGGAPGGPDPMTAMMDKMLEFTTAHEVAHQYWHGLVGNDSRLHPFVDESLAQFSAVLYLEDRYGAARAKADGDMNVAMNYKLMRLLGHPDAPVDRGVGDFGGLMGYAGIVYGKAPYFWNAIRAELGDATFFAALRKYVDDNRMKLAKPRALVDAFAAADATKTAKIRALEKRWLEGAHGDEDLGKADLLEMLGPSMGIDMSSIDPATKAMMQQLMQGLMGDGKSPGLLQLLEE
ncbi:MAG: M1 family aminopeptidase, partial [Polyangiaceae bacterium]